jgi:hypothetical protein
LGFAMILSFEPRKGIWGETPEEIGDHRSKFRIALRSASPKKKLIRFLV